MKQRKLIKFTTPGYSSFITENAPRISPTLKPVALSVGYNASNWLCT